MPPSLKPFYVLPQLKLIFLFKGSFYDRVDGVSMGSPLAPVLANLFMGHNEKDWTTRAQRFCSIDEMSMTLAAYLRVNKIMFPFTVTSIPNTLTYGLLSKRKYNVDNELAFLDVLVNNNPLNLQLTPVLRKKTFTGLLTNCFSFASFSYKIGLVKGLQDQQFLTRLS